MDYGRVISPSKYRSRSLSQHRHFHLPKEEIGVARVENISRPEEKETVLVSPFRSGSVTRKINLQNELGDATENFAKRPHVKENRSFDYKTYMKHVVGDQNSSIVYN